MNEGEIRILAANTPQQIEAVRHLFEEYAKSIGFSLSYQNFAQELADLPGEYAPPAGRLLLAEYIGEPIGCAALRRLTDDIGEMKRVYVKPSGRGMGIGRNLSEQIIFEARAIGYKKMRLDTVANVMHSAVKMYLSQGFVVIPPYRFSPHEDNLYFELDLSQSLLDKN